MESQGCNRLFRAVVLLAGLTLAVNAGARDSDWRFGIGTGLASFAIDGDIGFGDEDGGIIVEVDLDNSDTADMFESAFGFTAFAARGNWTVNVGYGTVTLEDSDTGFNAEWDKAQAELSVVYQFAVTGNHRWGAMLGVRNTDHEWEFRDRRTGDRFEPEDDWTDALVGLTHQVPLSDHWSWANAVNYGFGDSEGDLFASTDLRWRPWEHWLFNGGLYYRSVEFGDEDDIDDNGFYYYDVDEPGIRLGFMYLW